MLMHHRIKGNTITILQIWFQKWHSESHFYTDESKVEGKARAACPNVCVYTMKYLDIHQGYIKIYSQELS